MDHFENVIKKAIAYVIQYRWLIIEFAFFSIIFYLVPQVDDRMMESMVVYKLEGPIRIIASQYGWIKAANARILSNLFSALVDGYFLPIRAITNGLMLSYITYCIVNIFGTIRDNGRVYLIGFLIMLFVSIDTWKEVYYYATTLYISSIALVMFNIRLNIKFDWEKIGRTNRILWGIIVLASATWIETVSVALTFGYACMLIYTWIRKQKGTKYFCLFFSSLMGTAFMFGISKISTNLRGTDLRTRDVGYYISILKEIVVDNCYIWLILSILILYKVILCKVSFSLKGYLFQTIFWILAIIRNAISCVTRILKILGTNPIEDEFCRSIWGWEPLTGKIVQYFIKLQEWYFDEITVIMVAVGTVLFLCIVFKEKSNNDRIIMCSSMALGAWIVPVVVFSSARVNSLAIILTLMVSCLLLFDGQYSTIKWNKIIYGSVILVVFLQCVTQYTFINSQHKVAVEREQIASYVNLLQATGDWDYNSEIVMPKYMDEGNGYMLMGGNYEQGEIYYDVLLKYYNLDEKTRIVFE